MKQLALRIRNLKWWQSGILWGTWMFLIMTFAVPAFEGELITLRSVALGLLVWSWAGLCFGLTMRINWRKWP